MMGQKDNNNKGEMAGNNELSKANEWFNFVIEATNTGTWKWNVQTGKTIFNEIWANLIGYSLDELGETTIDTWGRLCHPDDLKKAKTQLDRYFRGETDYYEAEFRMQHKDGHWVWILDRGKISEWTPGRKPLWMSGTHQDITRQKKTEMSLKIEETRLEGLLRISQYQAKSIQQLLDFALDEAIKLTDSEIGYIYFYSEKDRKFTLNSWSKEVMRQCTVTEPQTIYELEKTGLWGEAVRQRKPIIDNHFAIPSPLKKGIPQGHAPLHKFLTIPVFSEEKIVAVVGVANKSEDYNNSDIRQLQLMMDAVWKILMRHEDEIKIRKLNRLYALLSQLNRAIVHNQEQTALFKEICNIAIEYGNFKFAWIGLYEHQQDVLKPVAFKAKNKDVGNKLFKTFISNSEVQNFALEVLRQKRTKIYNSINFDELSENKSLRECKECIKSSISLPILIRNRIRGVFSLYSEQPGYFTNEEILILEEVTSDINHALESIEKEKEHSEAIIALEKSEQKFRNLITNMQFGLAVHEIITNEEGTPVDYRFIDVNPGFERITGLKKEKIIGKTVLDILPDTEKIWIERYGKVALTGKPVTFENYAHELNRHYNVVAYRPQPNQFAVIIDDITKRKKAEDALNANLKKFETLSHSGTEMLKLSTVDDIYRYLTNTLYEQYPNAVILFVTIDESRSVSKLQIVKGVSEKLVKNSIKLTGYNFFEKEFKILPLHHNLFTSGKLRLFDKGLAGFSGAEFPEFAAKAIEKMLGIRQIYTIGINKDEHLYASIHFFNRSDVPITDNEYIELLVNQAAIIIDKKTLEENLRESEERHRLMFETSQESIVVIQHSKLVYFNPKLSELLGFKPDELFNKEFMHFVHPDDVERVKENYTRRIKGEPVVKQYQFRVIRKDGDIRWVTLSGSLINWDGRPSGFYFLTDVTELKDAEHQAKERLKELGAFYRLSELTEQKDLPADELYRRFTNDFPKSIQYTDYAVARLVINNNEFKTPNCPQKIKWNLSAPVKIFGNKTVGIFEVGYIEKMPEADNGPFLKEEVWLVKSIAERLGHITERKMAEEQLRQSEQKFRLLFENSPLGIYIGNADGTIEEGNKALLDILGSPSLEATRQINVLTFEPLVGNGYAETYKRCIEENKVLISEIPYKSKWGKSVYLSSYLVPLAGPSGKVEKVFTLMEDITERKEIEEALKETADELKQLNVTKDKFFSIIAHDLRAPFSSLVGFTELMADEKSKFSVDEYLQYSRALNRTAHSASSLLENLLEWSSLQRKTLPFEPRKIDLDEFFAEIEASTSENANKKSINVYFDYTVGLLVKADENMFHSIMRNLISNAIKFTKPGGDVYVNVEKKNDKEILVSVKDNGIGMDKKRLDNLFLLDTNVSRPGTEGEPSTGLGLILCKEFVEKHGGEIWAESTEGKGSKFIFTLPVKG